MFASSCVTSRAQSRVIAARMFVCALAGLAAGCSAKSPTYGGSVNVYSWNQYAGPRTMSAPVQRVAEMEDDGLPVQDAPPARIRQIPDDPSQPWSRNYGGRRVASEDSPEAVVAANEAADGYPVPMSPEEAGIRPTDPISRPRRAAYVEPLSRCIKSEGGWICSR